MYDGGKIIAGLVIFLVLVTFPWWFGAALGQNDGPPDPKLAPEAGSACVMPKEFMTAYHMDLLDDWRDEVVREGLRVHIAPDGQRYDKSLTNTCLACHTNKDQFCDACHDYLGVTPYCWDCHLETKGAK